MSRSNPGETALNLGTVSKIRYLRSVTLKPGGGTCGPQPYTAPTLVGGDLYVSANGQLAKYQASDGQLLWETSAYGNYQFFSVAVSGGLVIAGSEFCGSQSQPWGRIQAFSAATGKPVWTALAEGRTANMTHMVVQGGLIVGSGYSAANGEALVVHQASTGKLVWHQGSPCLGGPAVVTGGLVIFAACTRTTQAGFIQADNLATGARIWRRPGNWVVQRGDLPTAAGTNLFASIGTTVYDLDPATGATKYTLTGATSVLAVSASEVFAACSSGEICGYNLSGGSQLWTVSDQSAFAAEAGGVLYLADGQALNASTGAQLRYIWHDFSPPPNAIAPLAVGEGRIAVVNDPRVLDIYGLPGS